MVEKIEEELRLARNAEKTNFFRAYPVVCGGESEDIRGESNGRRLGWADILILLFAKKCVGSFNNWPDGETINGVPPTNVLLKLPRISKTLTVTGYGH